MTVAALNRALLARQGLLERLDAPLVQAVEAVGALQAQYWPAPPVALWSRVAGFAPEPYYAALERGELVTGTLLRATLHLVSAREHPAYAAVAAEAAGHHWRRTDAEPGARGRGPAEEAAGLRRQDAAHRRGHRAPSSRSGSRSIPTPSMRRRSSTSGGYKWRPFQRWSAFVRAPADGAWGTKAPSALLAAPRPRGAPKGDKALDEVVRRHLRAFGPAGAEDVAGWIGWRTPPVRAALERLAPDLAPLRGRGRPRPVRPPRRAPARPRDAGASPSAGGLRQRPARLCLQAPRAHPPRRPPRRGLRAAQPADPPQLPRRRARGGDVVDRGQAARGDAHAAPARASRARDAHRGWSTRPSASRRALQPQAKAHKRRRRTLRRRETPPGERCRKRPCRRSNPSSASPTRSLPSSGRSSASGCSSSSTRTRRRCPIA